MNLAAVIKTDRYPPDTHTLLSHRQVYRAILNGVWSMDKFTSANLIDRK